jgi:hypothetical protein
MGVTASADQRRGDVELRNYLRDQAGSRHLVFDLPSSTNLVFDLPSSTNLVFDLPSSTNLVFNLPSSTNLVFDLPSSTNPALPLSLTCRQARTCGLRPAVKHEPGLRPAVKHEPGLRPAVTHDRVGSSIHPQQNRLLTPQDIDAPLRIAAQRKIQSYRQQYAANHNISFSPAIVDTSTRMHGEFLRLLFLQAHWEKER